MPEYEDNQFINGEILEDAENRIMEPDMYRVLLHNDHYTSMDFVVEILQAIFHKHLLEAVKIMLDVHRKGIGFVHPVGVVSGDYVILVDVPDTYARYEAFPNA